MTLYDEDDMISFAEPYDSTIVGSSSLSEITARSCETFVEHHQQTRPDNLSGLADLTMTERTDISPMQLTNASANGMHTSSVGDHTSILSPSAHPDHASGSIVAQRQDQTFSYVVAEATLSPEYKEQDMQHLDFVLKEIAGLSIEDGNDNTTTQQHSHPIRHLPPGLGLPVTLPMCTGPFSPPSPAQTTISMLPEEHVVRITMPVWDDMRRNFKASEREKQALRAQLAKFEKQAKSRFANEQIDLQTEIGKLKYQNEVSKTQKARMAQLLLEKDTRVEKLKFELNSANERLQAALSAATNHTKILEERDCFETKLREARLEESRDFSAMIKIQDVKVQELSEQVDKLQKALRQAADNQTEDLKTLAENRLDQLKEREKLLRITKEKYAIEHTKVCELESKAEDLRRQLSQVSDLPVRLSEKSRICDQLRTSFQQQEKQAERCGHALNRATNISKALCGAAHLVKPTEGAKLSPRVMGCAECYAKNISCDNTSVCRNCSENNERCVRWRCSLRHVMERCPRVPCTFPHEADGWLLAPEARPDW
ncbi:hypothetical protein G6514_009049 [Epicoccum nigrum]|nr:hypothetical protein G6514_009049 [Epicoccum nigrum]